MNQERWQQIDRFFDEILELSAEDRKDFINKNCAHDEDLKKELLSLLQAYAKTEHFIEGSAIKIVTKHLINENDLDPKESFIGQKIESFTIKKLIGEGGMGEVYLAQDENLKREVALKILPPHYTQNVERVRRLRREARAISTLNHPNIVTIHNVGKFEKINYITTEFVEGKTLREILADKPDLGETLNIFIQCCDALSAAHTAGIIHRDIKPENIMVRPDGYVKVLDFGLAKLTESNHNDSLGLAETLKGTIMGTPSYMSPDQASGNKVDQRTDLWSLGVVLYELLTGNNPFKKDNRKATIRAIITEAPQRASEINGNIPNELDLVLIKLLEKNPDLSYQNASDLRIDLLRIKRELESSPSISKLSQNSDSFFNNPSQTFNFAFLLFPLLLIPIAGLIWYFYFSNPAEPIGKDWTRAKNLQLTTRAGTEYYPNLSPDGRSFIFSADNQGNFDIFLQRVGGKNPTNLTANSPEKDTQPAFSNDGKFIAFRSEREPNGIYIMEETGENPRQITDFGYHPSWSPDGTKLVVSDRGFDQPQTRTKSTLWIIDIATGEKRKLTNSGNLSYQPTWSPNGKRIAFWMSRDGGRRDVATISIENDEPILITKGATTNWNPVWSPDGRFLYFSSDRSGNMAFWRVRINETTGEPLDEPEIVPTPAKFNSHLSFSKNGNRLIYVQSVSQMNLKEIGFDSKTEKTVGESKWITRGDYIIRGPKISPDGKQFVVRLARKTQEDLLLMNRDGGNWRDLTNDKHFDRYAKWSPDGENIVFLSDRGGEYEVWLVGANGTNPRQLTFDAKETRSYPVFSPDGKNLSYNSKNQTFILNLKKKWNENNNPQMLQVPQNYSFLAFWDWSSDGDKLLGTFRESVESQGLLYYSFNTKEYEKLAEKADGRAYWLKDSRRFVFTDRGKAYISDIETKKAREVLSFPNENINYVSITPDEKFLFYTVSRTESDIWLLNLESN